MFLKDFNFNGKQYRNDPSLRSTIDQQWVLVKESARLFPPMSFKPQCEETCLRTCVRSLIRFFTRRILDSRGRKVPSCGNVGGEFFIPNGMTLY